MNGAVRVNMHVSANTAGRLSLEDSIERGRSVLREVEARCDIATGGQHDVQPVLMQDMHRFAMEEVSVLTEDKRLRSFAHNARRRHHEHVFEFFHRDMQPHALAGAKSPDDECLAFLLVTARLVRQGDEEVERAARWINRVREVSNLKDLLQRRPMRAVVFGEFDLNRPAVLSGLLQKWSFPFEGVSFNVERMMIGQVAQQLPGLHLLTKITLSS